MNVNTETKTIDIQVTTLKMDGKKVARCYIEQAPLKSLPLVQDDEALCLPIEGVSALGHYLESIKRYGNIVGQKKIGIFVDGTILFRVDIDRFGYDDYLSKYYPEIDTQLYI